MRSEPTAVAEGHEGKAFRKTQKATKKKKIIKKPFVFLAVAAGENRVALFWAGRYMTMCRILCAEKKTLGNDAGKRVKTQKNI